MAQLATRDALYTLMRRCVECPSTQPSCPSCKSDETCSLVQQSCSACASTTCVKLNQFAGQVTETKKATPMGPIIGGVLAGVVAMLVIIFCIWYFCAKPRRRKDTWDPPEKRDQSTLARTADSSRAHSIASTVLTRASNVIQIAYIPGVTGRSPATSPVPPMPALSGMNTSNTTPQPDTHFFMADDLRNSTWSDTSVDPRISIAPSLARASSATTVYYESAVVPPVPAQHAFRAQANMVSVKQGGSSGASVVSLPSSEKQTTTKSSAKPTGIQNSSIVARNVTARPIEVKKSSSANRVPTVGNLAREGSQRTAASKVTSPTGTVFEEKEVVVSSGMSTSDSPLASPTLLRSKQSEMSLASASTSDTSALIPAEGVSSKTSSQRPESGGLAALIEDAIKNASTGARGSNKPTIKRSDSGPFSDIHELPSSTP